MKCKDCTNYICHHRTSDAERDCFFEEQMVIETNKLVMEFIDWDKFRREAAKDILCAVLPSIQIIDGDFSKSLSNAISNSIDTADELVKQLKEKEEK